MWTHNRPLRTSMTPIRWVHSVLRSSLLIPLFQTKEMLKIWKLNIFHPDLTYRIRSKVSLVLKKARIKPWLRPTHHPSIIKIRCHRIPPTLLCILKWTRLLRELWTGTASWTMKFLNFTDPRRSKNLPVRERIHMPYIYRGESYKSILLDWVIIV